MTTLNAQDTLGLPLDGLLPADDTDTDAVLHSLTMLASVTRWGKFNLRALMVRAIEEGATYQDIADAIGVSRQSAWEAINPRNGTPLSVSLDQLKLF